MTDGSYQISPKECDVSVSVLQNQIDRFNEMYSNICGRSASYNAVANTTATEFSELISENIRSTAEENEDAWGSALAACIHAVGVIKRYSVAVQAYNNRIEELEGELASKVSAAETTADKEDLVDEYQGYADDAWGTLEGKAAEVSDMLADGPTPEHIRTLTEAGHIGSVPGGLMYVITGDEQYFAVTPGMDGSDIGRTIQLAAEGDESALEQLDESLALMNVFMAYIARKQENGGQLTARELEILNGLNDHLDDADAVESSGWGHSNGWGGQIEQGEFFNSIEAIRDSKHLSEEQREQLEAIIGSSLLAASDERMGGSYDNLPREVQIAAEGPKVHSPMASPGGYSGDWAGDFEALTELFEGANQMTQEETGHPIQGGTELSAIMIGTVAGAVESWGTGGTDEETLRTMLEIATQNTDANYTILTGEYPDGEEYRHPIEFSYGGIHTDEGALIAALFSHEWSDDDDGSAARSLISWIEDTAWSDDEAEQLKAAEAMDGLMEALTSKEAHDTLSDTGIDIELEDGTKVPNASFTAVNGELADGLTDLFEIYISSFASEEGFEEGEADFDWERGPGSPWNDNNGTLKMSPSERLIYLEYIMGNEDTATRAHIATDGYLAAQTELFLRDGQAALTGTDAGILQSLVDAALHNEAVNRNLDSEEELARQQKIATAVANAGSNALSLVPNVGLALQSVSQSLTPEIIASAYDDYRNIVTHGSSETTKTEIKLYTSMRLLEEIMEREGGEFPDIEDDRSVNGASPRNVLERAGLIDQRGTGFYFDIGGQPSADEENIPTTAEIREAIDEYLKVSEVDWAPGGFSGTEFSDEFSGEFNDIYDDLEPQLRYDSGNIDSLYEGVRAADKPS
ncbi:hypothetical protein AB0I72_01875 [Nocardiopsis sp. NPDC049922]|uniref:TPR repeat region-containing protein n=1 Tax=Nocardiopsis sp. NPDC049922 TaxID=3155157 RepID=UPI0033C65E6A